MDSLANMFCLFSRKNHTFERFFQLLPDGEILDIDCDGHDNERYWDVKGDNLVLYDTNNIQTSKFILNSAKSKDYNNKFLFFEGSNKSKLQLLATLSDNIGDLRNLQIEFKKADEDANK